MDVSSEHERHQHGLESVHSETQDTQEVDAARAARHVCHRLCVRRRDVDGLKLRAETSSHHGSQRVTGFQSDHSGRTVCKLWGQHGAFRLLRRLHRKTFKCCRCHVCMWGGGGACGGGRRVLQTEVASGPRWRRFSEEGHPLTSRRSRVDVCSPQDEVQSEQRGRPACRGPAGSADLTTSIQRQPAA